ncbi:hypothetical protein HAX54_000200, partial [Datura stramonium]|nr:hypothetical protein [Datura stramonium]
MYQQYRRRNCEILVETHESPLSHKLRLNAGAGQWPEVSNPHLHFSLYLSGLTGNSKGLMVESWKCKIGGEVGYWE